MMDNQDPGSHWPASLDDARTFLYEIWETELEADDPFLKRIEAADYEDLNSMLNGCDYTLFKSEADRLEYLKD
jgi:hypothetical protein